MKYKWLRTLNGNERFCKDKHTSNLHITLDDVEDIGNVRIIIEDRQCGIPLKNPHITIRINEYSIGMGLSDFLKKVTAK